MEYTADHLNWLRLVLTPGLGSKNLKLLLDRYGSPEKILGTSHTSLIESGSFSEELVAALLETMSGKRDTAAQKEFEFIQQHSIRLLTILDQSFPKRLKEIPNPPVILFLKGTTDLCNQPSIAIVGTRECDSYGLRVTRDLAGELAHHSVVIVSGLARGIDGAAHKAALAKGGITWAFLPCGFGEIYPPEHAQLAEEICSNGALISEYPSQVRPNPRLFPPRNRLVSGISMGVIVVQAPAGSGALITARYAMEQNRDVFAVPGRIDEPGSEGPHRLIQDGAKLIRSAEDVLDEIHRQLHGEYPPKVYVPTPAKSKRKSKTEVSRKKLSPTKTPSTKVEEKKVASPAEPSAQLTDPLDQEIVKRLQQSPLHIDHLAGMVGKPVRKVSERLLLLEMGGIINRLPGMMFELNKNG